MNKCSLSIPLKSWRLEDDIFEHMTLYSWYSCRGKDCDVIKQFKESIDMILNRISGRNNTHIHIWYPKVVNGIVHINLITSEDMSVGDFKSQLIHKILDKLHCIKIGNQKVNFNFEDSFYSTIEITPCSDDILSKI